MKVQQINYTNFKSLNSVGVKTPKAEALVQSELQELNYLSENYDVTLSSNYIPFGFGDESLLVSVTPAGKKQSALSKLFSDDKKDVVSIVGCKSAVDLTNTAIANSDNKRLKNASYKMELRDPNREGLIRVYTKEEIERLQEAARRVHCESTENDLVD